MHFGVHVRTSVGHVGPPPEICGMSTWCNFAAPQLFLARWGGKATMPTSVHHGKNVEQVEMLV